MTVNGKIRVGQIVPSSNTTMETEVPELLRRREEIAADRFSFHSSRMRMQRVTPEELARMDAESDQCAQELSDARVDVIAYACLVAIMAAGHGYHRVSADRLRGQTAEGGGEAPVVTSAGALIDGLHALDAKRIAVIAPYMTDLTKLVVDYIEHEGIAVSDSISLEIPDNLTVGSRDPGALVEIAERLDLDSVDAIVLSACVQMPSLEAIPAVEEAHGLPVVTASVCTVHSILSALGLSTQVPGGGALLSGTY